MAKFNDTETLTTTIELQVPRPVYITSGMEIPFWKDYFSQKKLESDTSVSATLYNRCLKILQWAEFCNATISYVGNAKDEDNNLTVKFTFHFPDADSHFLFQVDWLSNLNIVAKL